MNPAPRSKVPGALAPETGADAGLADSPQRAAVVAERPVESSARHSGALSAGINRAGQHGAPRLELRGAA
ncbi:hypothetical protein Ntsu_59540 [Nocardia sp. IFM 10818]